MNYPSSALGGNAEMLWGREEETENGRQSGLLAEDLECRKPLVKVRKG